MSDFSERNDEINARMWAALLEQNTVYARLLQVTLYGGCLFGFAIRVAAEWFSV